MQFKIILGFVVAFAAWFVLLPYLEARRRRKLREQNLRIRRGHPDRAVANVH